MADSNSIDEGRQAILAALERHQVRYVVIGGAAAQARGWPEPTDDIDVTPERSEGNLTRLAAAVEELDAGFRVDPALSRGLPSTGRHRRAHLPQSGLDHLHHTPR
jgi:predicted nucleotidyltransferase